MKKIFRTLHLWLSVPFGLLVSLICFSGAMLVFENEITEWSRPDLYQVKEIKAEPLPVEMLLERVAETLPDSVSVAGVSIPSEKGRTWQVNLSKPRRASVYIDPYTGEVKGKYERPAFFLTMFKLHRWLLDSMKPDGGIFWGMSQDAIANRLNELGILSPFEYKISSGSHYETGFRQKEQALWSSVTVRRILENEVYIGNLVQGKRTTPNHKVKQTYVKPEDDWIRIEKNHEPLVSDRDFEIVQRLLGMDTRTSPYQKQVYLLSGIAVCADCGAPMTRKVSTVAGKKYAYYLCSTNKETKRCSSHRIPEKDLEDAVLVMLKQHIQNILHLKRVLEFIGTVPFQEINMKKLQDRLEKKKQEKERCKELRMMLYSDMKEGIVSKEDYVELHAAYGKRLRNAEESIRAIQKEMDNELEKADKANTWLDYFVKYQDIEELSRTVVVELIRQIRVYDKKNIEITFDFDDCYQTLLNQLPAMGVDMVIDDDNNLQVNVKEVV